MAQKYDQKPCPAHMMLRNFEKEFSYKGCQLTDESFIFHFDGATLSNSLEIFQIINSVFLFRLGTDHLATESGPNYIKVFISSPDLEYLNAATILDRYFTGRCPTLRLQAEFQLYQDSQDWKDAGLLEKKMQELAEKRLKKA